MAEITIEQLEETFQRNMVDIMAALKDVVLTDHEADRIVAEFREIARLLGIPLVQVGPMAKNQPSSNLTHLQRILESIDDIVPSLDVLTFGLHLYELGLTNAQVKGVFEGLDYHGMCFISRHFFNSL